MDVYIHEVSKIFETLTDVSLLSPHGAGVKKINWLYVVGFEPATILVPVYIGHPG